MPIISISLAKGFLKKLDEFKQRKGYSSRSEVIRDAVRDVLSEYEMDQSEEEKVTATITVISEHGRNSSEERLTRLRHEYDEIVSANMHIHLGRIYCLEIFITEGEAYKVLDFIGRIRAMRGIRQVKYTMVPLIEE